ncbi:hypothetical protein ACWFMG_22100 [Bacillus subtilis]
MTQTETLAKGGSMCQSQSHDADTGPTEGPSRSSTQAFGSEEDQAPGSAGAARRGDPSGDRGGGPDGGPLPQDSGPDRGLPEHLGRVAEGGRGGVI